MNDQNQSQGSLFEGMAQGSSELNPNSMADKETHRTHFINSSFQDDDAY